MEENYESKYNMILPRAMLFRSSLLHSFQSFWERYPKKFISHQLLSDDIIFNVVATRVAQVRWVVLPTASFLESITVGIHNNKSGVPRKQVRNNAIQAIAHNWPVFSSCRHCDDNIVVTACKDRRSGYNRGKQNERISACSSVYSLSILFFFILTH